MSEKYFVYAGGRWCEVDVHTGRVSGWRARARFCFVRGQKLHAARSAPVLRALRALAAGAPTAVRDAAPLPRCPRRPDRSRSRRRSACRPSHAHCCAHTHGRCDVNANELQTKLPNPPVVASPREQRRASSSEQGIRIVESVHKSPVKQSQVSPQKSPRKLNRHNRRSSSDEVTKPAHKPVTRARLSSQQHVNVVVIDRNSSWSSSSESEEPVARGKTSPKKSPQKLRRHKYSSDEEETRKPVTRARQLSRVHVVVSDKSTSSTTSSDEEAQKPARGKASPKKLTRHKSSSDEEGKRKPVTRARQSSRVQAVVSDRSTSTTTSDEEAQKSRTSEKPSKLQEKIHKQSRLEISSDEDSEVQPTKPVTRSRPQKRADVIVVEDDSDDHKVVKKTKAVAGTSGSSSEKTMTKSRTKRKVSKAEKLMKRLLDTSEDVATDVESERAGTGAERSARCKELVIGETDVETMRRFVKECGGRENLARFDRDERYKLRIFHRLNPLVILKRHRPLERLLRQRLTIKEFARNLGLRSVSEVTPEKRYRMRSTTKNARVNSDAEDKENVARPKRRRLWNNDNAMLNSVRESISSEVIKAKPQIIKPKVNQDSSEDASDSDAEFKRKFREQLSRKQRTISSEGIVRGSARSAAASRSLKENVKPNSSSTKVAEMLESSEGEPRQTRFNKNTTPIVKPRNAAVSEDDKLKSAKVNSDKHNNELRQTRSSTKGGESTTKPKQSEHDKVVKRKVIQTRNSESAEQEVVRNTRSSNVEIPARTLKEQNKKVLSDTDSAFETSKSSPKKANLIRKGKVPGSITNLPKKKGKYGGSKKRAFDSARANEGKTSVFVKSMTVKPVKFKKSSVANGREYTSLEDHAIVAWVCGGHQRERLVNGNRLWRELELEYRRLTGQERSWHSLRNRYLRYVLPALGTLALPPAQVSRLRAAAAAGEIKSRGAKQRRNSIFTAPAVRSASAALHAGKKDEEQSVREQKSKTDAKEHEEKEVRKQSKPQTGGTLERGKGGRWIKDAPTPKKDPPSPVAPRVTRASVGSPSKGNRHK